LRSCAGRSSLKSSNREIGIKFFDYRLSRPATDAMCGGIEVIARNDNKVYQQDLTVILGVDGEIEVLGR